MARRTYEEQERKQVLADVAGMGVTGAASQHGIPPTTIRSWIDRGKEGGSEVARPASSSATIGRAVESSAGGQATTQASSAGALAAGKQTRRRYTEEEKLVVVAEAGRLGVCGAAKERGIAESNVSRWCTKLGVANIG